MNSDMVELGLILIAIAWFWQLRQKTSKLHPYFIIAYIAGVALLILDSFEHDMLSATLLNTGILALAVMVLLKNRKV